MERLKMITKEMRTKEMAKETAKVVIQKRIIKVVMVLEKIKDKKVVVLYN
jgi:hypothetical protein